MLTPYQDLDEAMPHSTDLAPDAGVADHMRAILEKLGEDVDREGLQRTPQRYAKAMAYLASGYDMSLADAVGQGVFSQETSEIVLVRDIELYSLCEHHLLPFFGKAHVAYIPDGKIIGLSKIPRIVDMFARRFQVQERLTTQINEALTEVLRPAGVAVIVEAAHFCMMMRGVQKQHSFTTTSSLSGVFKTDPATRKELMSLLNRPNVVR